MWSISILTVIQKSKRKRPWRGFFSWRISTFYLHACILFNLVESYHTCLFSCLHTCIRFLILVFFVLAQYEMLVLCNPLSKCPSATPFLFLLARTQYYFFYGQDETISLCICGYGEYIVFYGDNNCDLISWYGDTNILTEKQENKWHIYWQCWEYVYGNKKIIYFGSSDCYHYRAFEEMIFLQLSYKTFKPCFTVILYHERWASKMKGPLSNMKHIHKKCVQSTRHFIRIKL